MKIQIAGCYGGRLPGKNLTTFIVDDEIMIDAGGATQVMDLDAIKKIKTVLVSHGHLDHVYDLAMFGDVIIGPDLATVEVHANGPTIDTIKDHLMNDALWPDFTVLPTVENPVFSLHKQAERAPFKIGNYEIEFVRVNHPAPCSGMMLRWDGGAFLYTADTGTTEEIWEVAKNEPNLKGIITEVSFPNMMEGLSVASGHFSPCHLPDELAKIGRPDVPVYLYHLKPAFEGLLREEIAALDYPCPVRPLEQGEILEF